MSIAHERIDILFEQAEIKASEGEIELADRYVELAQKISMKTQETIPRKYRRSFCGNCGKFLRPGMNSRVRINSKRKEIIQTCESCGDTERYGFKEQ